MRIVERGTAIALAAIIGAGGGAAAGASATLPPSLHMPYDDCLREIGATAGRLRLTPEVVEDRPGLHVVRFATPAGRIVLGCSIEAGYLAVGTRG